MKPMMLVAAAAAAIMGPAAASSQTTEVAVPAARQIDLVTNITRPAKLRVPAESKRSAYLLTYFKDETHGLYFAVSRDGYSFTDVNNGQPIAAGRDLAEQKGIRDPYITRGPDGAFYMALTDLHVFGKREGLRTTEWERPRERYSWGNNFNLIFMKSWDLLHWTHARVRVSSLFPAGFANAGCMWAPEMIWDPAKRAMMVYFTTRQGTGPTYMVYSYANPAFTTLTTEPKQILSGYDPKALVLDADITRVGGKYRMFYVQQGPNTIRQAVSSKINSGYVPGTRKVEPEQKSAEAPNLWRRHGTNSWVLMYDVFGVQPHNMGFAETTDFQTFRNIGRFNEPQSPMRATNFSSPKHGAVMAITPEEATRLETWFAGR